MLTTIKLLVLCLVLSAQLLAQLPNGTYTLKDTLNASTGSASATSGGVNQLKVVYTKTNTTPPTTHTVNLAYDPATGHYVDNATTPTKRFRWVVVGGVTYYWYETKNGPDWVTDSSGTM